MQRLIVVVAILILSVPFVTTAQIYLSGAQSDTLDAGEYIVEDDIWVESNTLWYLRPGVVLRFYEGVRCTNHGALYAMGVEGDSIRFESFEEGTPWRGIKLQASGFLCYFNYAVITGSNDTGISTTQVGGASIRHCRISSNSANEERGAGIHNQSAFVDTILNTSISDNDGVGLYADFSALILNQCNFTGNSGNGIFSNWSTIRIKNTLFQRNEDSAMKVLGGGGYVDSCEFRDNRAELGAAFYGTGSHEINKTLFTGNVAERAGGAVYLLGERSDIRTINSIFASNYADSGAAIFGANSVILNSVFMENGPTEAIFVFAEVISFRNCLFFQNEGGNIFYNGHVNEFFGNVNRTNVNGDSCDLYQNLFMDPQFIDPENFNFHLQPTSVCIDAGTSNFGQIDIPDDPDGTIPDIGINFYNPQNVYEPTNNLLSSDFSIQSIYPNPFNNHLSIKLAVFYPQKIIVQFYTLQGQLIESKNYYVSNSSLTMPWNCPNSLSTGFYYVRILGSKSVQSAKVLLLK